MEFRRENFCGFLACTTYCPPSLQTITEKTFADRHKTVKFAKVFSLYIHSTFQMVTYLGKIIFIFAHSMHLFVASALTTASATPTTSQGQSSSSSSTSDEVKSKPKLPSFWVPSLTPAAKPTEIKKPVWLLYPSLSLSLSLPSPPPLPHPPSLSPTDVHILIIIVFSLYLSL